MVNVVQCYARDIMNAVFTLWNEIVDFVDTYPRRIIILQSATCLKSAVKDCKHGRLKKRSVRSIKRNVEENRVLVRYHSLIVELLYEVDAFAAPVEQQQDVQFLLAAPGTSLWDWRRTRIATRSFDPCLSILFGVSTIQGDLSSSIYCIFEGNISFTMWGFDCAIFHGRLFWLYLGNLANHLFENLRKNI